MFESIQICPAGPIWIRVWFQISIPAVLTNYTLLPNSSAFTRVQLPFSHSLPTFTGCSPQFLCSPDVVPSLSLPLLYATIHFHE